MEIDDQQQRSSEATSRSVEWYSQGEERVVEIGGVWVAVGFVGRKGRRARIVITAPAGATFRSGKSVAIN